MRSTLAFGLGALLFASCGGGSRPVGRTQLVINSPQHESTVLSFKPLAFSVTATNRLGIKSVELRVGEVVAKTCEGNSAEEVTCALEALQPTDFSAQVKDGSLVLSATAVEVNEGVNEDLVRVSVKPIRVAFLQPVASGDPAVAVVSGKSTLALEAESEVFISRLSVKDGQGVPLRDSTSGSGAYEWEFEWATMLGGKGDKVLRAEVIDSAGNTDTAVLNVRVE